MIKYLHETRGENMTLKINDITIAYWYCSDDVLVHADMKIHIIGVLTMGKRANIKINEDFYRSRIGSSKLFLIPFSIDRNFLKVANIQL